MTAFLTCGNKPFDFLTLADALIDDVDTLAVLREHTGIRITEKTIADRDPIPAIGCADKATVLELFQRALGVGTDGRMTLNVVHGDSLDGAGLNPKPCASGINLWERLSRLFVNTTDGEVAVYVAHLTT